MRIGSRVDLVDRENLPREWKGRRGTVVEKPLDAARWSVDEWIWVKIDGIERLEYFYAKEIRRVSELDLVAEAAAEKP